MQEGKLEDRGETLQEQVWTGNQMNIQHWNWESNLCIELGEELLHYLLPLLWDTLWFATQLLKKPYFQIWRIKNAFLKWQHHSQKSSSNQDEFLIQGNWLDWKEKQH